MVIHYGHNIDRDLRMPLKSFTTAALLYRESNKILELNAQLSDWSIVRKRAVEQNLLQMRTPGTSRRICSEVIARLTTLTPAELSILRDGSPQEQRYVLWLAVCKRYRFVCRFAKDVVREKVLRFDYELTRQDYDSFFRSEAERHPELDRLTETTRNKQRQFIFRTLREADLLSHSNRIQPAILSPRLLEAVHQDDSSLLSVFPVFGLDIKEWTK